MPPVPGGTQEVLDCHDPDEEKFMPDNGPANMTIAESIVSERPSSAWSLASGDSGFRHRRCFRTEVSEFRRNRP